MRATEFKARIKEMGLTQAEAARAMGTTDSRISLICNGLKPTDAMVAKLEAIVPAKWAGKVRMGRPKNGGAR